MTCLHQQADAVVIGGGPGGAMTALHLARLGWHTLLIEKGARGRVKPCGHCLNIRAIDALRRAGVGDINRNLAYGNTRRFRVHAAGEPEATVAVSLNTSSRDESGWIIDRAKLDQQLRDCAAEAGATVLHDSSAKLILCDLDAAQVQLTTPGGKFVIRTSLVVGADGLGSAVARAAGLFRHAGAGRRYGLAFDVRHPKAAMVDRSTIEMFFAPSGTGYLGVVNCGGGVLHVAALVNASALEESRSPIGFVHGVAGAHPLLHEIGLDRMDARDIRHLNAIGPMPWHPQAAARGPVALVGDAAGYIDPFTGEGMGWAIESAELVGQVASECVDRRWNAVSSREYARLWKRHIARRQRTCRALAWMLVRPRVASAAIRAGAHWPWIAQRVAAKVVAA